MRSGNMHSFRNVGKGNGFCQMQMDVIHSIPDGVDIFPLKGTDLSCEIVTANQGYKENIQIGFHQKGSFRCLRTKLLLDLKENAPQRRGITGENSILKILAVGETKIDVLAAQTVKGCAKEITGFELQRQNVHGRGGNFSNTVEFVAGEYKNISALHRVYHIIHTVGTLAGQNAGDFQLGVPVHHQRPNMFRNSHIKEPQ